MEVESQTPKQVFQHLAGKGILIRDVSSYPMLGKALRVTIGTPEENNAMLNGLREVL